jgi:hypothetical protein
MEEEDGGAIIAMEAKDQRENLSLPRGGGHGGGSTRGRPSPPLSRWRRSAIGGTIAAVIVFINITFFITILISFQRSTLPHPAVIPYLNMVLYATYYDPMMCCHPMMF